MAIKKTAIIWSSIYFFLFLNVLTWSYARNVQPEWLNVPQVPSEFSVSASALGDQQLAYRLVALMLQHLGDHGGRTTALKDYDYDRLAEWFFLSEKLDNKSDHVPYLAAFYFSGSQTPKISLPPLIEYLRVIGNQTFGQKWRWLAQAVFLARYKVKDMELALDLANQLAKIDNPDMPAWARSMPALIQSEMGDKEAAIAILVELLSSSADKMHPNEVNNTLDMICNRLLDEHEAKLHPLCKQLPPQLRR